MLAKFGGIINNITASHHLSFSEEEVPNEGRNHNQPLHIAVKCGNYMIARTKGPSLNVMPKTTLDKLYCPSTILRNNLVVVRDFDSSKRELLAGPALDTCHGGNPFIATPEITFVANGKLISIMGEKEIMVSTPFPTDYIEEDEEALETPFQALEIVGATNVEMGSDDIKPSKATIMVAKVLIANGFEPSKGLGTRFDGIANPMAV
ncbi:hypothetical protein CR513_03862, partial [Mucuna pruriens]